MLFFMSVRKRLLLLGGKSLNQGLWSVLLRWCWVCLCPLRASCLAACETWLLHHWIPMPPLWEGLNLCHVFSVTCDKPHQAAYVSSLASEKWWESVLVRKWGWQGKRWLSRIPKDILTSKESIEAAKLIFNVFRNFCFPSPRFSQEVSEQTEGEPSAWFMGN